MVKLKKNKDACFLCPPHFGCSSSLFYLSPVLRPLKLRVKRIRQEIMDPAMQACPRGPGNQLWVTRRRRWVSSAPPGLEYPGPLALAVACPCRPLPGVCRARVQRRAEPARRGPCCFRTSCSPVRARGGVLSRGWAGPGRRVLWGLARRVRLVLRAEARRGSRDGVVARASGPSPRGGFAGGGGRGRRTLIQLARGGLLGEAERGR